jgi:hypothetical protein
MRYIFKICGKSDLKGVRPWEDMEIISAVFAGLVIIEGFGKICGTQRSLY